MTPAVSSHAKRKIRHAPWFALLGRACPGTPPSAGRLSGSRDRRSVRAGYIRAAERSEMAIVVLVLWAFTAGAGFYLLFTSSLGRARPAGPPVPGSPASLGRPAGRPTLGRHNGRPAGRHGGTRGAGRARPARGAPGGPGPVGPALAGGGQAGADPAERAVAGGVRAPGRRASSGSRSGWASRWSITGRWAGSRSAWWPPRRAWGWAGSRPTPAPPGGPIPAALTGPRGPRRPSPAASWRCTAAPPPSPSRWPRSPPSSSGAERGPTGRPGTPVASVRGAPTRIGGDERSPSPGAFAMIEAH